MLWAGGRGVLNATIPTCLDHFANTVTYGEHLLSFSEYGILVVVAGCVAGCRHNYLLSTLLHPGLRVLSELFCAETLRTGSAFIAGGRSMFCVVLHFHL